MKDPKILEARRAARVGELRAFMFCLGRSRFSLIVLIAGLALLLSDQGQDLLIADAEDGWRKILRLAMAATLWALSVWGWSRVLLDIQYDEQPGCLECYNRWRRWLPRALGVLSFAVVAYAAALSGCWELVTWLLAAGGLFLAFVVRRRDVTNRIASRLASSRSRWASGVAPRFVAGKIGKDSQPAYKTLREALGMPVAGRSAALRWGNPALFTLATTIVFVLCAILATWVPVWLGNKSGAMILFFVWGITWLPIGSLMSYAADKHGLPLLSLMVLIALLSSFTNDNHEIRPVTNGTVPQERPSVTAALRRWAQAEPSLGTRARPIVIVATAGGGIRAAYWTGTVLGELDRLSAEFRPGLFAVSGVSGGSLGAVVYRGLVALPPDELSARCPEGVAKCAQRILGEDFLGPMAAAMLYPDFIQRFLPLPILPDRGEALERSWERSFSSVTGSNQLAAPLSSLNQGRPWPALFLNSTWSDAGRRLVASNLRYGSESPTERRAFERSSDELSIFGHDVALSTAAHNSARFPFVSPPGMWRTPTGAIAGRLQDGGLFENYGAETALEVLDLICAMLSCVDGPDGSGMASSADRPLVYPVIIMISSDPTLPRDLAVPPETDPIRFAYEVRSTVATFANVRNGRGAEAAVRLQEWSAGHGKHLFQFRMCESSTDAVRPPLGWALSDAAKAQIAGYLDQPKDSERNADCYRSNRDALLKVTGLLRH